MSSENRESSHSRRTSESSLTERSIAIQNIRSNHGSPQPSMVISRDHLLTSKMDLAHAKSVLGPGATPVQVKSMLATLEVQKMAVNSYARMYLKRRMVEKAISLNMKVYTKPVREYSDIPLSWAIDGSMKNAEKLFDVMYGDFDRNPTWLADVEREYMEEHGWSYKDSSGDGQKPAKRGCVQMLITRVRNELLKAINLASKKRHGRIIVISRDHDDITNGKKHYRRNKGTFLESYVRETKMMDSDDDGGTVEEMEMDDAEKVLKLERQLKAAKQRYEIAQRDLAKTKKKEEKLNSLRETIGEAREVRMEMTRQAETHELEVRELKRNQDKMTLSKKPSTKKAKPKKRKTRMEEEEDDNNRPKSEYELFREAKVRRNALIMEELGLQYGIVNATTNITTHQVTHSNKKDDEDNNKSDNELELTIFSDDSDSDEDSDDDDPNDPRKGKMQSIVEHRQNSKDRKYELKMKWKNGYMSWEPIHLVKKDVPVMVKEYFAKEGIDLSKKGKSIKGATDDQIQQNNEIEPVDKTNIPDGATADVRRHRVKQLPISELFKNQKHKKKLLQKEATKEKTPVCTNDHVCYDLGIAYKEEWDLAYWSEGQAMCGVDCGDCGAKFGGIGVKKPVMTCTNREKGGCKHAVCNDCFHKGAKVMMEKEDSEKREGGRRLRHNR